MQPSGMRLNNTPKTYFLAEQVFALALLFIDKNVLIYYFQQSVEPGMPPYYFQPNQVYPPPDLLFSTKHGTRYAPHPALSPIRQCQKKKLRFPEDRWFFPSPKYTISYHPPDQL